MSTLTRQASDKKIPDYKDYMNFISAYGNGTKKETTEEMHRRNITVTSMRSTLEKPKTCESYSNFLEKTKTKKFGSVKPPIASREVVDALIMPNKEANKVKTEIFININGNQNKTQVASTIPKNYVNETIRKIKNENIQNSSTKKLSEHKKQLETNNLNSEHNRSKQLSSIPFIKENKIVKEEKQSNYSEFTQNIKDKQADKIPQNNVNESGRFNGTKSEQSIIDSSNTKVNTSNNTPDKVTSSYTSHVMTSENVQIMNEHFKCDVKSENTNGIKEVSVNSTVSKKEQLIQQLNKTFSKTDITDNGNLTKVEQNKVVQEDTFSSKISSTTNCAPPPPPPMPNGPIETNLVTSINNKKNNNFNSNRKYNEYQQNAVQGNNTQIQINGYHANGGKKQSPIDGSKSTVQNKSATLDRNDPLVKKLAYGAMLDMYGAYHDKANSYVATLPKKQVQKQSNLQRIIDNIAAQGGLDKLSGRSNPKSEVE